jgi:argininosuccinate lyase
MAEHDTVMLRERLREDPSADLVRHVSGPALEREMRDSFDPQMQIHLAHTAMLARQGIVSREDARRILATLVEIDRGGQDALERDPSLEDLYSHVERALIRKVGPDVGGRMHTGRSRNDLGVTTQRLVLRGKLLHLLDGVLAFEQVLVVMAGEHVETVMPGLTHSQHAQVITLGYYLAALADVVARDRERLEAALGRVNKNPLGAAALTTTGFPLDRAMTARLLGFDGLVENGYDAIVSRDDVVETGAAVALLMTHLSRLCEDLWLWSTLEFGYAELADRYCSVSSIMPQKKNPGVVEKIKALAAEAVGGASAAFAAVKNTSFSECGDAQTGGNRPVYDAVAAASTSLELLCGVLRTLTIKKERMQHLAEIGFATMTELADVIVREKGMSFRMAHNIVGLTVRQAVDEGKSAMELTGAMLDVSSQELFGQPLGLSEAALRGALDPWQNIVVRKVTGGPAPEEMARMLGNAAGRLKDAESRQEARRGAIKGAREELTREVASV